MKNDFKGQLGRQGATGFLPQPERLANIVLQQNPYVTGVPLPPNSPVFFGRQALLHQALSVLRRPEKPGCVSVVGERRIGKTSFLNQIRVALGVEPGVITLVGNAQEWETPTPEAFYASLHHAIASATGTTRAKNVGDYATFRDEIAHMAREDNLRFVLMMDEFDVMANTPAFDATFFTRLRALANEQDYRFGIVTASFASLHELRNIHSIDSSAFWNLFGFKYVLGLLRAEEAQSLVSLPMGRSLPEKRRPDFNAIWKQYFAPISGCHPAFIQMIAENLWATIFNDEPVDQLHLEQGALEYFEDFLTRRTPTERAMLTEAAHHRPVAQDSTCRELIQKGLLTSEGAPFSALFADAIVQTSKHAKATLMTVTALDRVTIRHYFTLQHIELSDLKDKKEIYILGENGDGKTLLLQAILLLFRRKFIQQDAKKGAVGALLQLMSDNPALFLHGVDDQGVPFGRDENIAACNVFAYGVNRSRKARTTEDTDGFLTLFGNDVLLVDPAQWLMTLHHQVLDQKQPQISLDTAKSIFCDLLDNKVEIQVDADGVTYIEKGAPIAFDQLSEGFKSVLVWVTDLLIKLSASQPDVQRIADFTGVVLVDEIELHLHPKWEYAMVARLRAWFQNIQFIVTTHSPTVIRGASEDAVVYRIYKHADAQTGKVISSISEPYQTKDMAHWMANSLVTSPLFDLPHARMAVFDSEKDRLDTEEDYWYMKIHAAIKENVRKMQKDEKVMLSKREIDDMVKKALDQHRSDG